MKFKINSSMPTENVLDVFSPIEALVKRGEKGKKDREEIQALLARMDVEMVAAEHELAGAWAARDTDALWKTWSMAAEAALHVVYGDRVAGKGRG